MMTQYVYNLSFLGLSKHVNNTFSQIFIYIYIYKTTQVHRTNTGKHNLHLHTKT